MKLSCEPRVPLLFSPPLTGCVSVTVLREIKIAASTMSTECNCDLQVLPLNGLKRRTAQSGLPLAETPRRCGQREFHLYISIGLSHCRKRERRRRCDCSRFNGESFFVTQAEKKVVAAGKGPDCSRHESAHAQRGRKERCDRTRQKSLFTWLIDFFFSFLVAAHMVLENVLIRSYVIF